MNVDELQSVQSRERQTDKLQQLRSTFYADAGEYVAQLREERKRAAERADDPFDAPEVTHLTDDINTAEKTIEAIYERRVGKIVKMASLAAADMPTEDDGLTQEERTLFETMVEAIEQNRNHVLDVVAGETDADGAVDERQDPTPVADTAASPTGEGLPADAQPAESGGVDAASVMGGSTDTQSDQSGQPGSPAPNDPAPRAESEPQQRDAGPATTGTGALDSETDQSAPPSAGDGSAPEEGSATESGRVSGDAPSAGPGTESPPGGPADGENIVRRTVRITENVGEIFGVDEREYDLSRDDVVALPRDNADPLVEQDAAEPLE